ncbi:hypothetical protein T492DRAFT_1131362 [Pavlovales sp. CCMP2436]|nr:hypothetical protein T492DRAFT_1131362 [Pavlovales sp. CCMP2436]
MTGLGFKITNNNSTPMTLDGGAHSLVESLDLYFASNHVSNIGQYGCLFQTLQSFSSDPDSLRSSGTMRELADFSVDSNSAEDIVKGYYNIRGATILPGESLDVIIPLLSPIGTLSHKALPLSALTDSIRLEVKLAPQEEWGTYGSANDSRSGCTVSGLNLHICQVRLDGGLEREMYAQLGGIVTVPTMDYNHFRSTVSENAGAISMQIPVRVSSMCSIFVVLRESNVATPHTRRTITERTRAGMVNYQFKIGNSNVPQSPVDCTGNASEARMELMYALETSLSDSATRSCVSGYQFTRDGFAIGLNLQAFPQSSETLSDGVSSQLLHIIFNARLAATHPAMYIDVWVMHEKILIAQNGMLSYKS